MTSDPNETTQGTGTAESPEPDFQAMLGSLTASDLKALHQKAAERDNYLDLLRRKQAEMENINKRVERDRIERNRYAAQGIVAKVLPVLDNLDQTAQALSLIADQIRRVLADSGVETIAAEGQRFDPNLHEAVLQEETEEVPEMTIVQELSKGYKMYDRILRPTKVKVARRPASKTEPAPERKE